MHKGNKRLLELLQVTTISSRKLMHVAMRFLLIPRSMCTGLHKETTSMLYGLGSNTAPTNITRM